MTKSIITDASLDLLKEHIQMWTKRISEGRYTESQCELKINEVYEELKKRVMNDLSSLDKNQLDDQYQIWTLLSSSREYSVAICARHLNKIKEAMELIS